MRRFNPEPPKCVFCDLRLRNQAELIDHERQCAAKPPYPFCRTPTQCAGKGYCPKDIACNE